MAFQGDNYQRLEVEITCSKCGAKDTVPFEPRPGSEVYCKKCWQEMRGDRKSFGPRKSFSR